MADQSVIEHTALAVVKQTLPSTTSFVFGGQGKRADSEAERARPACDRGADCAYRGPLNWNRARCHGIRTKEHGNAGRIAPIPLDKRRSQWLIAASTGNRQDNVSVSTAATWHPGSDAVGTTVSTWQQMRMHVKSKRRHGTGNRRHGTDW
jgi:hypothetical protein